MEDVMSRISDSFTEEVYKNYLNNPKYRAIENAITNNGLLKSLKTRQSEVDNDLFFQLT